MPLTLSEARLPWTGAPVQQFAAVRDAICRPLDSRMADYLPRQIELYVDLSVPADRIEKFLGDVSRFLVKETAIRDARLWRLLRAGLCTDDEIDVLTRPTHHQIWALYYSEQGGLPEGPTDPRRFDYGTVPCSTMRNHGVSWKRQEGRLNVWLVTAPKPGQDWDMDSDIGHESAHAAFAPVPLFVQSAAAAHSFPSLIDADQADQLEPDQMARLMYFCSEIAVVGIRGESRRNDTRLPIADPEELFHFLHLMNELFPDIGFDRAQRTFQKVRGNFDMEQSDAVFDLTAPVLRVLPQLNRFTDVLVPPTTAVLRSIAGRTSHRSGECRETVQKERPR